MASKDTPQEESTDDMSIDELSAAIDAHMDEIDKPKPKKKKTIPKATKKSVPTPVAKKKEEPKEKAKEEDGGDETKIAVKHAYVSKKGDKGEATLPEKEKSQITHTSNVKLKPLGEADKKASGTATNKPKADTIDVVVKTPAKIAEPKEDVKETEPDPEEETETVEATKDEAKEEGSGPEQTEPVETKEKPVIKSEPLKPETAPQQQSSTAALDAQMPSAKPVEATPAASEGEALKTFDTKQYHIPIKAGHHHRAGGSFKVFIAVLAMILATIYVLSELEIIDLAALVSA